MVLITNLFTLTLSTMLYASRVHEIRVEHQERIAMMNADTMAIRRIQGQITIEDILGRTEEL